MCRILGWNNNEIIDSNISKVIPKIIADVHDFIIKDYLMVSESQIIYTERIVQCLNREGYLVPCTLQIGLLPTLDNGIEILGFLLEIE
jgi:PAS domain S-box-containing protein